MSDHLSAFEPEATILDGWLKARDMQMHELPLMLAEDPSSAVHLVRAGFRAALDVVRAKMPQAAQPELAVTKAGMYLQGAFDFRRAMNKVLDSLALDAPSQPGQPSERGTRESDVK